MEIASQLVINGLVVGSFFSLIAVGFTLIYGVTKFFNLAHGITVTVAAYVAFVGTKILNAPLSVSIIAGIAAAALTGFILEKGIYLPLRRRKASNMTLLIASLGIFTAGQSLIAIIFSNEFHTLTESGTARKTIEIFGGFITDIQITTILVSLLLGGAIIILIKKTSLGKAVQAIKDDEEVAKIVGINTNRVIGYVFLIGSGLAGLNGILVGIDTGITPNMGFLLLLGAIVAAIVGGIGNIYGALIGSYLVGFAESIAIWFIGGEWRLAIAFAILIIILLIRPQGVIQD
jgi:branched-subunit amino acid ABC-type transport system permease component